LESEWLQQGNSLMPYATMTFDGETTIGRVMSVDTMRVFIQIDDHDLLREVMVGNLIAIQGATGHQYLIALVERITRLPVDMLNNPIDSDIDVGHENDQIQDTVRAVLVGTYRSKDGAKGPTFKRGADSCPQIDQACHLVRAANLSAFMGVLSQDIEPEKALRLGHYAIDSTAAAIANGDRFFQRHAAILGSTGSGKSCTVAAVLERANALNHANILLLDMHGEYRSLGHDFVDEDGGKHGYAECLKIAGPGDLRDPQPNVLFLPYWLLNRDEMLAMLVDRSDDNAPNQAMRFTSAVLEEKRKSLVKANRDDVLSTFTVDSPVPYSLSEVLESLRADDRGMVAGKNADKAGPWNGRLTRFISRLEAKLADRRYGFLFNPPGSAMEYEWLNQFVIRLLSAKSAVRSGIKVIDFSEVPSDVLPTVVSVLARILYDVQFWMDAPSRTPVCLVCDEAHLYLPLRADADASTKRALDSFERIAKEGRKYGFSLLVVSQRPSDVSRTILSQCNNFIALRLTNEQDQSAVRAVMPDSMAGIAEVLPLLDIGEAIVLGDAILLPSRVKLDLPSVRPLSLTKNFWKEWGEKSSNGTSISLAVENLRRQSRNVV
jgi:uncharacterized protein